LCRYDTLHITMLTLFIYQFEWHLYLCCYITTSRFLVICNKHSCNHFTILFLTRTFSGIQKQFFQMLPDVNNNTEESVGTERSSVPHYKKEKNIQTYQCVELERRVYWSTACTHEVVKRGLCRQQPTMDRTRSAADYSTLPTVMLKYNTSVKNISLWPTVYHQRGAT